ncbi:hypothetical protein DQ397_003180 [Pseudomonas sp. CK-NBRI-02]|nr:hypothetical protein DQ397_003180 [Pseudomonas sp. CK-NBRI-02]
MGSSGVAHRDIADLHRATTIATFAFLHIFLINSARRSTGLYPRQSKRQSYKPLSSSNKKAMKIKKKAQSSELTGGAGFAYEGYVSAYFLAALLTGELRPPLNMRIKTVALQQSAYGAPLDDIIITFDDAYEAKLHLQVKRSLRISAAKSNKDFREIVKNSWLTYKDPKNPNKHDHYGAATDTIALASLRNFRNICLAAKHSNDEIAFFSRNNESGTSSVEFEKTINEIKTILRSEKIAFTDPELHEFFKNFIILNFDVTTPESISNSDTINRLSQVLTAPARANDLWERLKGISRDGAAVSATYDSESLKRLLYPLFKFGDNKNSSTDSSPAINSAGDVIFDAAKPVNCSVAISNQAEHYKPLNLTAVVTTDKPENLATEIKTWKEKLKRSSLLSKESKLLAEEMPLKELVKHFQLAHILLQHLATADFSAYIYYYRETEVDDWSPENIENEMVMIPLFHRISKKHETVETVYSEISSIGSAVASAVLEVKDKYNRTVTPTVSTPYARNRRELIELSDLVAEIAANYISKGTTYPTEYIAYISTRIRYGENVVTGEKHKRDRNPIA